MPRAEIATKQAKFTLEQLHAELGGKILGNKAEAKRLADAMEARRGRVEDARPCLQRPGHLRQPPQVQPVVQAGTLFREALGVLPDGSAAFDGQGDYVADADRQGGHQAGREGGARADGGGSIQPA